LEDAKVAAKLKITAKQKAELEKLSTANREKMMEMFRSGDRENMREKMTELREKSEKDTLAVLTAAQKKEFESMKGDPIDRETLFGGRGGQPGGGRGGRGGQPGGGGDQPQRKQRPGV
jgi:Spy/CpxP family protein refolding chaperone